MRVGVNGRYLTRRITGVDRFAREIMRELDKLVKPGEVEIAVPAATELVDEPKLKNIKIVRVGKHAGHAWEQLDYARYLKRENRLGFSPCNTAPLFNPGIVCIHDMAIRANAGNYSKKFVLWYRFMYSLLIRNAKRIITVSNFSKSEIEKYYPRAKGKISVVPNGWDHIERVVSDSGIFEKYPQLKSRDYYFAMSSLAPNKNLKWLVGTAKLNPEELFVIAGGMNSKVFAESGIPQANNVIYPGYVSDGEAKALMEHCKAFLYPTFYEGFGIPPMEALACGAPIVVSDTPVMHEIYKKNCLFINPLKSISGLRKIVSKTSDGTDYGQYRWRISAERLHSVISYVGRNK